MDLDLARVFAAVGAFLAGAGVVSSWVATLVGAVLMYVGVLEFLGRLGDARGDALSWLVYVIVASLAYTIAYSVAGFSISHLLWGTGLHGVALAVAAAAWVVGWVFQLASAYRFRRVLDTLARGTGEEVFKTADKLYWWGSASAVVVVGIVLLFVAYILLGVGFLTAKIRG
ncbi:DUF996 domain-containing protein [Pyrobaculum neutrophilum]|uniref:DUF996 domain-containing protein n=1 Tax=Pyrobaculum neutrophilum (strain DSM 2338 / JCM 9278 / NBRC 100436 / V24Sta) TaxID=444157 RepID=B1YBJ1_PYRNV|nr:DUF996 domain-containing protein [Pyrobaculum neutrophilum]ACB40793.1 protein of unknown function DUF996 [Pyrobaculum neutrophilum V24Sta]